MHIDYEGRYYHEDCVSNLVPERQGSTEAVAIEDEPDSAPTCSLCGELIPTTADEVFEEETKELGDTE